MFRSIAKYADDRIDRNIIAKGEYIIMAKIFVAMYNFGRKKDDFNAMPPFYETFLKGLADNGNQVLCFHHKTHGKQFDDVIPEQYSQFLLDFRPDLCILFCNNFWDISNIVSCPIIIYDVDSPLEFPSQARLKYDTSRYKFIVNQTAGVDIIKDVFGAQESQIQYIPFFSEIKSNREIMPMNNISFLGTNWLWKGYDFLLDFIKKSPIEKDRLFARNFIERFSSNPFASSDEIIESIGSHFQQKIEIKDTQRASIEISGIRRLRYLSALSDLGLEIRGAYWTIDCMKYFPEILLCYNSKPTFTLLENENFYNNSKISINTRHIQAKSGFSFRVCDILASNACLVSEECSDLKELFPEIPIPMFKTPQEAREICKDLIENNKQREKIVKSANRIIEKEHRFKNVLMKLQSFLGIGLFEKELGDVLIFSPEDPNHNIDQIRTFIEKFGEANILVPEINSIKNSIAQKPTMIENEKPKLENLTVKKNFEGQSIQKSGSLGLINLNEENSQNSLLIKLKKEDDIKHKKEKRTRNIEKLKLGYYNTIGKHLGYDYYHKYSQTKVFFCGIPLYRKIKPNPNRKEYYWFFVPLFSLTWVKGKNKIRILLVEKIINAFKLIKKKNAISSAVIARENVPEIEIAKPRNDIDKDWSTLIREKKQKMLSELRNKFEKGVKLKVCLFVSRSSCWMFDGLYKILEQSNQFSPYVVVKPFMSQGKNKMIEFMNNTYNDMLLKGYRVIKTYDISNDRFLDIRKTLNPDIVFYTKYWLPHFHPLYYIDNFMDKLTFYVPYSFDCAAHDAVYEFELLNLVDRFLYTTYSQKKIAEKNMPNKATNVHVVGSPKLEKFFDPNYTCSDPWKPQNKKKKRIIWAPHHEDITKSYMYQFDSFYYICDFMLNLADKYKEQIQIAFKPHPLLRGKLESRWGKKISDQYYEKWENNDNSQLEEGEFIDLFLTSDAMILDSLSFIAEYSVLNKPAFFTISPTTRPLFNDFGKKLYTEILYHTDEKIGLENSIIRYIDKVVLGGEDVLYEKRQRFIEDVFEIDLKTTPSRKIYDNIIDAIKNGSINIYTKKMRK